MEVLLTQQQIYDKYPKIFIQHSWPMQKTCMCWGLCVGDGWYPLIAELCKRIQDNVDARGIEQIEAVQVKEKYGGLRFYTNYYDDAISKIILDAEYKAAETCSKCSKSGIVRDDDGWIEVLCDHCSKIKDNTKT